MLLHWHLLILFFKHICDAPRQNQALLAKFCSAQEPKMHGARSNCRKSVNDGIEQRNYPAFHKSIYIS